MKIEEYEIMRNRFANESSFKLLTRRRVCPYDFIDFRGKVNMTEFPLIGDLYCKLCDENSSYEKWALAQNMWVALKIQNLGSNSDF